MIIHKSPLKNVSISALGKDNQRAVTPYAGISSRIRGNRKIKNLAAENIEAGNPLPKPWKKKPLPYTNGRHLH